MKYIKFIALILLVCMLSSTLTSCAISRFFDELINGADINITLPSFPLMLDEYSTDGEIESSIKITNIIYEGTSSSIYTTIYFSGEKTYDIDGDNYNRYSYFSWKLYDSEGYVVDSGLVSTPYISVGDKFKDETVEIWETLDPEETYELVISSYTSNDVPGDTLGGN